MTRALLAAIVPLVFGACLANEPVVKVEVNGARSLILIVSRAKGSVIEARAIDILDPAVEYFTYPHSDDPADLIFALYYPCALSALSLVDGPVAISREGRALPPATAIYRGTLQSSALELSAGTPAELTALRIPGEEETPCIPLEQMDRETELGNREPARFVLALPDGGAFYSTADGQFIRLNTQGEPRMLSSVPRTTPNLAALLREDGRVFLAGKAGRNAILDLETEAVEPFPTRTSTRGRQRIALAGGGDEIFLVTDEETFEYFDGNSWSILFEGPGRRIFTTGVVRTGPGAALAVGLDARAVAHYQGGELSWETLPETYGGPTTIADIEGYGPVIGSAFGRLLYRENGVLQPLATGGGLSEVRVIDFIAGALLHGGQGGVFYRNYREFGTCPEEKLAPENATFSSSRNNTLYLLSDSERVLTRVRPELSAEACE